MPGQLPGPAGLKLVQRLVDQLVGALVVLAAHRAHRPRVELAQLAHRLDEERLEAGVDFDHIVGVELVEEGVASFTKSFDDMISSIEEKAAAVAS